MNAGDLLDNKYRIEALLGQGGMGAVYLAENLSVGRKVAIKLLRPEYATDVDVLTRFKNEARAAAAIGHPGIVDVLDMGTTSEGAPYIVMERLRGVTMRQRLQDPPPLTFEEAVGLILQVLDVLGAAHAAGVIHRDLKPDNLFVVSPPGVGVKILDFGISKFRAGPGANVTQTGQVMGTPLYMSPEQAKGSREAGVPADLYSIGAILYELLSGRPPYPGLNYTEVLAKLLTEPLPPLASVRPGLPPFLCSVVERLLAKDPNARYASASETAEALRGSLAPGTGPLLARAAADQLPALGATTPSAQRVQAAAAKPAQVVVAAPIDRRTRRRIGAIVLALVIAAPELWHRFQAVVRPILAPPTAPSAPTSPVVTPPPPMPPPAAAPPPVAAPIPAPTPPRPAHASHHHQPPTPAPSPEPRAAAPALPTVPTTAPASAPAPAPSPELAMSGDTFAGHFAGSMDEDSTIWGLPPSRAPHQRFPQNITVSDSSGIWTAVFEGAPGCALQLKRVGSTRFIVTPDQGCQLVVAGVTHLGTVGFGEGSIKGEVLSFSVRGTRSVSNGLLNFTNSFSGSRTHSGSAP